MQTHCNNILIFDAQKFNIENFKKVKREFLFRCLCVSDPLKPL